MIDAQGYEPPEEWTWNDLDVEPRTKTTKCGYGCGHIHLCGRVDGVIWVCQWCYRKDQGHDPQGLDTRPKPWTLDQELARLEEDNPAIKAARQQLDETVDRIVRDVGRSIV